MISRVLRSVACCFLSSAVLLFGAVLPSAQTGKPVPSTTRQIIRRMSEIGPGHRLFRQWTPAAAALHVR